MALTKLNNAAISSITNAGLPALDHTNMPVGSIIQMVSNSTSNVSSVSSNTYTDFGLSMSFTPKLANSHIHIFLAIGGEHYNYSDLGLRIELRKDSSQVRQWSYLDYHSSDSSQNISVQSLQYSESAGNTNARTYDVRFQPSNGNGTARINQYTGPSFMTIQEIKQ